MAQGDSIGGIIQTDIDGDGTFEIRPPVGQVWIITYIGEGEFATFYFTDGTRSFRVPSDSVNNPEIKVFIDNNLWFLVTIFGVASDRNATWSGIQFK